MGIWPKQDRPYNLTRRVAIEGKLTIQGRHPCHQLSQAGRDSYQLAGTRIPQIQPSKYLRIHLL